MPTTVPEGTWRRPGAIALLFGVILPAFALAFEIVSGLCAALAFDPIPTICHVLLVACVPFANAAALVALRRTDARCVPVLARLNAAAIGIGLYFSVVFLPLFPIAVLALAAFGAGLVALSPALALASALVLRKNLRAFAAERGLAELPAVWPAMAAGLAALLLLATPKVITFAAAKEVLRNPADVGAVRFLRTCGNRPEMLRWCYPAERPLAPLQLMHGFCEWSHVPVPIPSGIPVGPGPNPLLPRHRGGLQRSQTTARARPSRKFDRPGNQRG